MMMMMMMMMMMLMMLLLVKRSEQFIINSLNISGINIVIVSLVVIEQALELTLACFQVAVALLTQECSFLSSPFDVRMP